MEREFFLGSISVEPPIIPISAVLPKDDGHRRIVGGIKGLQIILDPADLTPDNLAWFIQTTFPLNPPIEPQKMAFDGNPADEKDHVLAGQFGHKIISLACFRVASSGSTAGSLEAWVGPTLVHRDHQLASARGNHLHIEANNDIHYLFGWEEGILLPESQIVVAHYVRFTVEDKPMVLASLAQVIAAQNINIREVRQPKALEEPKQAEIAFLLDPCKVKRVNNAISVIRRLPTCLAVNALYKVLGNPTQGIGRKQ